MDDWVKTMKINYLLLDKLKRHGYYKGQLKSAYDPRLQIRLAEGHKVYILQNIDLGEGPWIKLLVNSLGASPETPNWLFELTITPKMASEFKVDNLELNGEYEDEEEVYIPWTPACKYAPMVQLCIGCWQPMAEVLRHRLYKDLQYPYICDKCGEVYSTKEMTEETRDDVEAKLDPEPEEDEE